MSHTYFIFEPAEAAVVLQFLPRADEVREWTYAYDNTQHSWYVRYLKQPLWLNMHPEGVPNNYRLELLLLQAAYA